MNRVQTRMERHAFLQAHLIKALLFAGLIFLALMFAGCGWFGKDGPEKPAHELVQDGVKDYNEGDYKDALESFEKLKDWYPFSKYAILAELKIGECHYHLQQYPEAVAAYEEFERLHPRNEATPYVVYQIGQCYFEQMDTVDRDQSSAQKALDTFRRLQRQYPNDPYAQKATAQIAACLKSLSGHEFYIGRFYFKQKQYLAARKRFLTVITQYPDAGYQYQALRYLAECEAYEPTDPKMFEKK
jgi:outer membrane protein assembly factor BamD